MVKITIASLATAFAVPSAKYYDQNRSRFPQWILNSFSNSNCENPQNTSGTYFCQPNRNSWEYQFPINIGSDTELVDLRRTMKNLYGDPSGRQPALTNPNDENSRSDKVWDFVENAFYRDGDLFVIPNKVQYQRLMKFRNSNNTFHTEFIQQNGDGGNEYDDRWQQETVLNTDEHFKYAKDFCQFLTGSEFDTATQEYQSRQPPNSLAEGVMYTPHSQAEFKTLFADSDYTTFSGAGAELKRGQFRGNSLCNLQNPDGTSNSKFWTGLYRAGANSRDRQNDERLQYEIRTDDPWFDESYRSESRNTCARRQSTDYFYANFVAKDGGCPSSINGFNNDRYLSNGEECWSNDTHPLRYQNLKNDKIESVNELVGGSNARQSDCLVVQCEQENNESYFELVQCNSNHFVPVCRIPILSCERTTSCDQEKYNVLQSNSKNQNTFCGSTRIVKETNDIISDRIQQIIDHRIENAIDFRWTETSEYSIVGDSVDFGTNYAQPWVFSPKRELLVSQEIASKFATGTRPVDMFDPDVLINNGITSSDVRVATSTDQQCPCSCGCIETNENDFTPAILPQDSDIHFHRISYENRIPVPFGSNSISGANRLSYIDFQYGYTNNPTQENAFTCHADLINAEAQLGNPTEFFEETKMTTNDINFVVTECKEKIYCSELSNSVWSDRGDSCNSLINFGSTYRITSTYAKHFYKQNIIERSAVPITDVSTGKNAVFVSDSDYSYGNCPQRHREMCRPLTCDACTRPRLDGNGCEPRYCQRPQLTDANLRFFRNEASTVEITNSAQFTCGTSYVVRCDAGFVMYDLNNNFIPAQSLRYSCNQHESASLNPYFCLDSTIRSSPFDQAACNTQVKCVRECVIPTGQNILTPTNWQGVDGTTTTVFCQPGFHLQGNETLRSNEVTCEGLVYPSTICVPEKCIEPTELVIENGYCYAAEGVTEYQEGSTATCRCNKCYSMKNSNNQQHPADQNVNNFCHVQYKQILCSNNQWSGLDIECVPLKCGNPPELENADLVFETDQVQDGSLLTERTFFTNATCGGRVYYQCHPGYIPFFESSDDRDSNPYSICDESGSGCFQKIIGSCAPITCPRIESPQPNSWMPIYLGSEIERFHDYRVLSGESLRNSQLAENFPVGTQALYECYEDFTAHANSDFMETTVNIIRDVNAANVSSPISDQVINNLANANVRVVDDNRFVDEFYPCCRSEDEDSTENMIALSNGKPGRFPAQIACHNSKVRRECMPNGEWSAASHTCKCDQPNLHSSQSWSECERYQFWKLQNSRPRDNIIPITPSTVVDSSSVDVSPELTTISIPDPTSSATPVVSTNISPDSSSEASLTTTKTTTTSASTSDAVAVSSLLMPVALVGAL